MLDNDLEGKTEKTQRKTCSSATSGLKLWLCNDMPASGGGKVQCLLQRCNSYQLNKQWCKETPHITEEVK
jgi:hypothetical protein